MTCKHCKSSDAYISLEEYRNYVICPVCQSKNLLKEYNFKEYNLKKVCVTNAS